MPSRAEVKTLKNVDGSLIIYPETISTAIYSPALGTNIEEGLLSEMSGFSLEDLVTVDTTQTITGHKTFTSNTVQANYPIINLEQTGTVSEYAGGHGINFLLPNIENTGIITPIWAGQSNTTGNAAGM